MQTNCNLQLSSPWYWSIFNLYPPPQKKISWFYSISNLQSQTQPKCKEEVQRSQGPGVQRSINRNKNKIKSFTPKKVLLVAIMLQVKHRII